MTLEGVLIHIHIGTDHAGFDVKQLVVTRLKERGHEVVDHGAFSYEPDDDYPSFCISAAESTALDPESFGVVLGGSGNGEQMAANLVVGVRAALVWNPETAALARSHNNANVIALGVRQHTPDDVLTLIEAFIAEPFSGLARHQRRIDAMTEYERR